MNSLTRRGQVGVSYQRQEYAAAKQASMLTVSRPPTSRTKAATVIGEITIDDQDFPWLNGLFAAREGFAEVGPLFARELDLLEALTVDGGDEAVAAWEAAYAAITSTVTLVAPNHPIAEFLLHIDGDRAWFRFSEEPFPVE